MESKLIENFQEKAKIGPNPFLSDIVGHEEIWGDVLSDIPDLNNHVFEEIEKLVTQIRQGYLSRIGILLKGDIGTGKSHSIRRNYSGVDGRKGV